MHRGSIAVSEINCDICGSNIEHGERYLIITDDKKEDEKQRLCVECCLNKGYAGYILEKSEKILTFFPEGPY